MNQFVLTFLLGIFCTQLIAQNPEKYLMVTLGNDTVGIEKYRINENEIELEAIRRVNSISKDVVKIRYREDGSILQMETKSYNPSDSLLGLFIMKSVADSLFYTSEGNGRKNTWARKGRPHLLGAQIPYYATYEMFIENYEKSPDNGFEFMAIKPEPINVEKTDEKTYKLSIKITRDIEVKLNANKELEKVSAVGTGLLSYEAKNIDENDFNQTANQWLTDPLTKIIPTISPRIKDTFNIRGTEIILDYSRTSKRGRKIFGGLVPYDKVWRTGSNLATHIEFGHNVLFEDNEIPKGKYTLFTIPKIDQWFLLINKETGQWGAYYDESQEILRLPMKIINLDESSEDLVILVEENEDGGQIKIKWDDVETKAKFKIVK